MSVYVTEAELRSWARQQGVALAHVDPVVLSHQPELARHGCLDDRSFFRLLGFDSVESADVSDWEGADHVLDLNLPVPEKLRGRYDAVFEAGTIQHVFDLPQVLANVHALLAPGGRVIHGMAPSSNHVDHGFHMFSPTLFHDFYTANGWRIEAFWFFEFFSWWHRGRFHTTTWRIRPYVPGVLDELAYGRFGPPFGRQLALFVVATKAEGATGDRIPQQSLFARTPPRVAGAGEAAPADTAPLALKRWKKRLESWLPRRLPPVVRRF
jgi:SAM-dependent methyltransferase